MCLTFLQKPQYSIIRIIIINFYYFLRHLWFNINHDGGRFNRIRQYRWRRLNGIRQYRWGRLNHIRQYRWRKPFIATTLRNFETSSYTYPSIKTILFTLYIALVRTRVRYSIKTYHVVENTHCTCLSCNNPNINLNHTLKIAITKLVLMFEFYKANDSPKMKSKNMVNTIARDVSQTYEDLGVFIFLIQQFRVVFSLLDFLYSSFYVQFRVVYVNILLVCLFVCLYIWF